MKAIKARHYRAQVLFSSGAKCSAAFYSFDDARAWAQAHCAKRKVAGWSVAARAVI